MRVLYCTVPCCAGVCMLQCLASFSGSAVVVSHDRWFLDRVCNCILAFEDDGNVSFFRGNYSEYERNKRDRLGANWQPKPLKHRRLLAPK